MPAPTKFSDTNVLISAHARSDAIRVFPTKTKFNGTENNNGMNIYEFLSLINSAQKQMNLSREEFLEFLLMCTTGKPHVLIKDWSENGHDIESIYYNLFVHYDMRMSPENARTKLFAYKAHKNSSLSKVTSEIMQLSMRAACVHPHGLARQACFNNDAGRALINCLPTNSSDIVSNKYYTLTSKLGRICTFVELSRALQINSHLINSDIAKAGLSLVPSQKGGHRYGPPWQKPVPNPNVYYTNNPPTSHNVWGRGVGQSNDDHFDITVTNDSDESNNDEGQEEYAEQNCVDGQDNTDTYHQNNYENHEYESVHEGTNNTENDDDYTPDHNTEECADPQDNTEVELRCVLCGQDHSAEFGCPNIRDDYGNIIKINPCPDCPLFVYPRLFHSPLYCPFRVGGPLGPNSS
jgi:hypothetical protein